MWVNSLQLIPKGRVILSSSFRFVPRKFAQLNISLKQPFEQQKQHHYRRTAAGWYEYLAWLIQWLDGGGFTQIFGTFLPPTNWRVSWSILTYFFFLEWVGSTTKYKTREPLQKYIELIQWKTANSSIIQVEALTNDIMPGLPAKTWQSTASLLCAEAGLLAWKQWRGWAQDDCSFPPQNEHSALGHQNFTNHLPSNIFWGVSL